MKLYAIKDGSRYLPIPDKRMAIRYGDEHHLANRLSHTNKGVVAKHLKAMQSMGVWMNAKVVEIEEVEHE